MIPFLFFLLIIAGSYRLPKFDVNVGYHGVYRRCKRISRPAKLENIEIQCSRRMRGDSVKISLLGNGQLSLCEVAVYANYS